MWTNPFPRIAFDHKWREGNLPGRSVKRHALTVSTYLEWRSDLDKAIEETTVRFAYRPEPTLTERLRNWLKPRQTKKG